MNLLDRFFMAVSPGRAMQREKSRTIAMHYRAARLGRRNDGLKASGSDADLASRDRRQVSFYARDMIRNTPFARRVQDVVTGHVVGDGIIPKVLVSTNLPKPLQENLRRRGLEMIEDHLDTTAIDKNGLLNLYGLQALAMNTVVESGEVLIRRHRPIGSRLSIPLQIEVLEPEYLDDSRWGRSLDGNEIREGIEYDRESGERVAYWLYTQHPGGEWRPGHNPMASERVPADEILHLFRVDRPGQTRGISWFTPIAEKLVNADDAEDAHLMRQKIAACFTAFHRLGADGGQSRPELGGSLQPGVIMEIANDEEMEFAEPPAVGDYPDFMKNVLRAAAMGIGLTYEALTGDLSGVNFSSARIGRLEMERNISRWQWLMLVPMLLQPLGRWIEEAWLEEEFEEVWDLPGAVRFTWVPPHRILVDPAREFGALREAVRSGFQSRQGVVRQLGLDPERLLAEQQQDKDEADRLGLPFDSDPRADVSRQNANFSDEGRPP